MKDFYSVEENFNYLYNDIATLLSGDIVDSSVSENWLANWYVCDRYNTTKAVEKYAANKLINKLITSDIPADEFKSIINRKLSGCCESYNDNEATIEDKKYMIENIQRVDINKSTLSYIIEDFECDEIVEYIEESYFNKNEIPTFDNLTENAREVFNIVSHIKQAILESRENQDRLEYIKDCNTVVLYKHKYVNTEAYVFDMSEMYNTLEQYLNCESDAVIEYTMKELHKSNELIDYLITHKLDESSNIFIYEKSIDKFNSLVESLVFDDKDMEIDDFIRLYTLTEALCDYEETMEASSRIIRKGTEKVTKAIGNASAKSRGMSKAGSKVAQVKRGAKIVDDRASDAINAKIDQIVNFTREQKNEKLITGKATVKLSRVLKNIIALIIAGSVMKSSPVLGSAVTIIGLLGARALSKTVEAREKRRILLDLETELNITREKIEDAKAENAKEKKYQLMRIEKELEKEIFRIKNNLKYY